MLDYIVKKYYEKVDVESLSKNLHSIIPNVDIDYIIVTILQYFYLASFWSIVKGDLQTRIKLFSDLAAKEIDLDKRIFLLVLSNLSLLDKSNSIISIYLNAESEPSEFNIEVMQTAEDFKTTKDQAKRNFWLSVGTTLDPIRGALETGANLGKSILSGELIKIILIIVGVYIIFKSKKSR